MSENQGRIRRLQVASKYRITLTSAECGHAEGKPSFSSFAEANDYLAGRACFVKGPYDKVWYTFAAESCADLFKGRIDLRPLEEGRPDLLAQMRRAVEFPWTDEGETLFHRLYEDQGAENLNARRTFYTQFREFLRTLT